MSKTNLRRDAIKGGSATLISQSFRFLISVGSTCIFARLLEPEDYGLIATVAPIVLFLGIVSDLGLTAAVLQEKELNDAQARSLFWVNLSATTIVALASALVAWPLAKIANEPRLFNAMLGMAAVAWLSGAGLQHTYLMRRSLQFGRLTKIEVCAQITGASFGVAAALIGAGYWSLIIMPMAVATTHLVLVLIYQPIVLRGEWSVQSISPMIRFGLHIAGFNLVTHCANSVHKFIVGLYFGPQSAGLFHNAQTLMLMPLQQLVGPVTAVALPVLSQCKGEPNRWKRYLLTAFELLNMTAVPIIFFCWLFSEQIVALALGPKWSEAAVLFRLLSLAGLMTTYGPIVGWILQSTDRAALQFHIGSVSAVAIVLAAFAGLPFGLHGVAVSFTVALVMVRFPSIYLAIRGTSVSTEDILRITWPALVAASGALLPAWGILQWRDLVSAPYLQLLIGGAAYTFAYILAMIILPGGADRIGKVRLVISTIIRKRSAND